MSEIDTKAGVTTNEFKLVAVTQAAPIIMMVFGKMPPTVGFLAMVAIACGYILSRGFMKLPLPGDRSSWSTSEMWVTAGSLVTVVSGHVNGAVPQVYMTVAAVAIISCFFFARILAKHDWFGYFKNIMAGGLDSDDLKKVMRDAAREIVVEAKSAKKAAA